MKTLFVLFFLVILTGFLPAAQDDLLHPTVAPFKTGFLEVSNLHKIYYECRGNPGGKPVFCLHGGPGVGSYPRLAQYFDPEKFMIVLHDQRGSGRSTPFGELRENTTQHLIADIEKLRNHLGLEKVLVFGGSWGTTLGLAYAEAYPEHVSGMLLRGVFLGDEEVVKFHYLGTGYFFPKEQDALAALLPDPSRGTDPDYLYELIHGEDEALRDKVLDALARFEIKFMKLDMPDETVDAILSGIPKEAHIAVTGIDLHYVKNRYFLKEGQLLNNAGRLEGIPVTLINGRYDMASPPFGAYRVHKAIPGSKLIIVEKAGHSESEEGITAALVEAAAAFE